MANQTTLDSLPMRRDPIFDAGGLYSVVVEKNFCLHKEAIEEGYKILCAHLSKIKPGTKLKILDLACGGNPIITGEWMRRFSDYIFAYTGVDLNLDQVRSSKKFSFSKNVETTVMEGDIWALEALALEQEWNIVFMGLNTHHAVPETISNLSKNIYHLLGPRSIFINHDLFRPQNATSRNWREEWFAIHKTYMLKQGLNEEEASFIVSHMRERDFPISMIEMGELLKKAGFDVSLHEYRALDYPRPDFFGMVVGYKGGK